MFVWVYVWMFIIYGKTGQDKMSLNVFYSTRIEERLSEGDH